MNQRILLVSLRDPFLDSDRVMPPLGIMALHAWMLECGFASTLENQFDFNNIEQYADYTHIGISCMTPQKAQAYRAVRLIHERLPGTKVILGGPHADFYLEECQKHPFDYIVTGDGELALKRILEGDVSDGERLISETVSTEQMNAFPLPYRGRDFINQYSFVFQGIRATTILTAKGCPMSCAFCEHARTKVRMYTPENITRQMTQVQENGFGGVMFFDDIFTLSEKRVREMAKVIRPFNMPYRCFGHARTMTRTMARQLADSGCVEVGYGAESGSDRILHGIHKKTSVEQNRQMITMCNEMGIRVKAFIMLGLPGEDRESVADTARFLEFLMAQSFIGHDGKPWRNDFDMTLFFPYRGTEIRQRMEEGDPGLDIHFNGDPDGYEGFYKGRGGSSDNVVRPRIWRRFSTIFWRASRRRFQFHHRIIGLTKSIDIDLPTQGFHGCI